MGDSIFKERFKDLMSEAKFFRDKYSCMSLEEKLGRREKIRDEKKGLEDQLRLVDLKINLLESFEDIKDYDVENDELAVGLLNEFGKKDVTYFDNLIREEFSDESSRMLCAHYVTKLENAGYILVRDGDSIYLTEKGRNLIDEW